MAENSVLIVIPHHNFRDEEYQAAHDGLQSVGANVTVASTIRERASGTMGMSLNPDLLIDDVNPSDYNAVVFIGGTGASQYWHDITAHEIAKAIAEGDKLVAASSHAPVTLAVAGLLRGKKATGHVAVYEKLKIAGADFTGSKLERDGNIITSSGPNSAKEFGQALAQALN
ncbi:DJ-1/PfpI family protein [bacterium]|nr:DJ-1/PfpI family protein [bacterium]